MDQLNEMAQRYALSVNSTDNRFLVDRQVLANAYKAGARSAWASKEQPKEIFDLATGRTRTRIADDENSIVAGPIQPVIVVLR